MFVVSESASLPALPASAGAVQQLAFWSLDEDSQPLSAAASQALLDPFELARLARLRRPADAQRFLAAHAGLRLRLAQWLGTSPSALRLSRDGLGKPLLGDYPDNHFNLSHSDGFAMLALASRPVGVDLEKCMVTRDLSTAFMQQILAPQELAALSGASLEQQAERLTEAWVGKEAVMKASGLGVRLPATAIQVDRETGRALLDPAWFVGCASPGTGQHCLEWVCHPVPAPVGYRAALALPANIL